MEKIYYFNDYNKTPGESWPYQDGDYWAINPQYACDDNIADYAESLVFNMVTEEPYHWDDAINNMVLITNTCPGINYGPISKVEVRAYLAADDKCTVELLAIVPGIVASGFAYFTNASPAWTTWYDLTNLTANFDPPNVWTWSKIQDLDMMFQNVAHGIPEGRAKAYAVELRVTHDEGRVGPLPVFLPS